MEKVLVSLYVPVLGTSYDVQIPLFLTVREVSALLARMLEEATAHRYTTSGQELLCSVDQNLLFRQECTLREYHVQNGERLLFM